MFHTCAARFDVMRNVKKFKNFLKLNKAQFCPLRVIVVNFGCVS